MIDDKKTGLQFNEIRLSRNKAEINIDAADLGIMSRVGLRYFLELWLKSNFAGTSFEKLITIEASEVPPYTATGEVIYEGAYLPIEKYLDSLLTYNRPAFNQKVISVCENLTSSFYLKKIVKNRFTVLSSETVPEEHFLKAGILDSDFVSWGNKVLKDEAGLAGKFLTNGPKTKRIFGEQPEYLYYLTNINPLPTKLRVRVLIKYVEEVAAIDPNGGGINNPGLAVVDTPFEIDSVFANSVYCIPIGPKVLGLARKTQKVASYEVWVSDENNMRLSEVRIYVLDGSFHRKKRFVLFSNSLGGFDSVAFVGNATETLKVVREESERYSPFGSDASFSERVVNRVTGERELNVNTGWLSDAELWYLQDLLMAQEIYLQTDRNLVPLRLVSDSLIAKKDNEMAKGRNFVFRYENKQNNHSALPPAPVSAARATAWRGFGAAACLQNANGLYTGLGVYAKAEKYYVDTNEAFIPRTIKENIFGTEGFLPPMVVNACAVTPFVNANITRDIGFLKNDCGAGLFGATVSVSVASGTWGSKISQADADAKAEAAWALNNNQAYANLNGACVLPTFVNVKISRFGDMARNDCNTGYFGQKPLIEIAAGVHGSMISQADADAKAETAWALNNNQAYANLNGACVLPTFVNIAISRLSTMARNNCLVGSVGEKLLIEIAAGVHGSMISQADANANAEAAWSILNTQSNVNANAVCTAYSNGLRSKYFSHPISAVYDESVFISGAVLGAYDEVQIDHVSNFDDIHPALYRMPNLTPDLNYFGLQFNGFLKMPTTGVVRLYLCTTGSDDWAKLFLANNLVLSRTDSNLPDEVFVDFGATENELLLLKLNFIELAGDNLCSLRWSYAGQAKIVVPASAFYKEP